MKVEKGKSASKRKYYSSSMSNNGEIISSSQYKLFLVRIHDEESGSVQTEGPYPEEEKANHVLNSYLKKGICSWLVSYNE